MKHILLVEDDEEICEILQFFLLERENYNVAIAHTSEQALALFSVRKFDLVLLDIMLPGQNGIELCAEIRKTSNCPIIFISCINDDETIIKALNMGGDDYLVKPFRAPVLLARIDATLRRTQTGNAEYSHLIAGDLRLDANQRCAYKKGEQIKLSPTEYGLLHYFMSKKGQFVSFEETYEAVWERPSLGDVRALFVHVSHLRQKIEEDPNNPVYITTHLRDGYIFSDGSGRQT